MTDTRAKVSVGDWMPHITLPNASGETFDSWDCQYAGRFRVYWVGAIGRTPGASSPYIDNPNTALFVVEQESSGTPSALLDRQDEFSRIFGIPKPFALIADGMDRVATVLADPTMEAVAKQLSRLQSEDAASGEQVAPILMLDRIADEKLREALTTFWEMGNKQANRVGGLDGNVSNSQVKRRLDVEVDDPILLAKVQNCLSKRVMPAIRKYFQTEVAFMEAPIVGCYASEAGGYFAAHRDDTSAHTRHRQFAVSVNLNGLDDYEGGALRFPEFSPRLYRPPAGSAAVFSASLVHEVMPVTRGRRLGLFSFFSSRRRAP